MILNNSTVVKLQISNNAVNILHPKSLLFCFESWLKFSQHANVHFFVLLKTVLVNLRMKQAGFSCNSLCIVQHIREFGSDL